MTRYQQFEDWVQSEEGQKVLTAAKAMVSEKNEKYIRNCLWWAFTAGENPLTQKDNTPIDSDGVSLLKDIENLKGTYFHGNLRRRVRNYLSELESKKK